MIISLAIVINKTLVLGSRRSWRVGHIKHGANGATIHMGQQKKHFGEIAIKFGWRITYPSCISQIVISECEALPL